MLKFIVKRLIQMIPILVGMAFVSFLIIKLAPGDYLSRLELNPAISKQTIENLRKLYGLDRNVFTQFLIWMWNALHFNLGYSFAYHKPVTQLIMERAGNTLELTVPAFLLSWLLSIPIGIVSAVYHNRFVDRIISILSFAGISIPSFFMALSLMYIAAKTGLFPVGGMVSQNYAKLPIYLKFLDRAWHMMVPLTSLVIGSVASLSRLIRSTMIDEIGKNYVMVARAKGIPNRDVLLRYAFRNAMNPFITLMGFGIADLLSGSVLVEIITAWPGLGRLMFNAVMSQDVPLIMGSLYIGGIMLLIGNLIADVLIAFNDPRIRHREVEGNLAK